LGHAEVQDFSRGKLNAISDFLQETVVRAVPFRPPLSDSNPLALRGGFGGSNA
jgi:hypothetical protein